MNKNIKNKTVIVTGAAQGFGAGIAKELSGQGANIVIADLNQELGQKVADDLSSSGGGKAIFLSCDVADYESVEKMVSEVHKTFGRIDVLISNAGILRAGTIEEMDPSTFELITKINYQGYFNCVKAVTPVMKKQYKADNNRYMDIIQVNSKSGLKGSNKNFAYAGGKFGGLGLTQSFALELMPFNIKVNSICPGNFFEGPLWADPETGLFKQYLDKEKVPGALTLEDVKAYYEKQVPAGRGCRVKDVVKAINYAIEQEYETGQAIPVTGGQIMLK